MSPTPHNLLKQKSYQKNFALEISDEEEILVIQLLCQLQ